MDLAARRPDQVAGLVLANATAEPRTILRRGPRTIGAYLVGAAAEHVRSRATRPGGNGNGHSNEPSAPWAGGRPVAGEAPDAGDDGPATDGWLFRGGARAMLGALREAFVPRLAAYPGPTLIINGQGDVLFRTDERAFLRAAADGRLLVVPDCDHLVNEDRPDVFNSAVRAFAVEVFAREAAGSA
jgi:pimeloyl-ACP methyl ester carboxylesterase